MARRGRRILSLEEAALWRSVAATATPLVARSDPPAVPPLAPEAATTIAARHPVRKVSPVRPPDPAPASLPVRVQFDFAPDPHAALAQARPHMDHRRFEKLRRGRIEPDARLDLHGMTAERAHGALNAFLLNAHGAGHRLVLVITGKGRAPEAHALAPQRHGVLRHSLPHWLAAPPLGARVLQIAPAHPRHGGAGAYYVYLRRPR